MASGNQQRRLRLRGIFTFTVFVSISQVQASIFGKNEFYNAVHVRGVATPQETVLLSGLYPRGPHVGNSLPMESSWRYTGGGSGPNAGINLGLFRRQTTGDVEAYCNQGMHVCRGFDAIGCCNNNAYCIITKEGDGKCCPLGSVCGEDPCSMTSTFCRKVVTVTPTNTAATAQATTSTNTGCCLRACSYTMHLCDQKFGGYCCGNDAVCLPNKMCQATPNPNMPTTSIPTKVTVTTQKCSTGSFACAAAAGGGCCPDNMICTDISSTPGCARSGSGLKTRVIFSQTASGIVIESVTENPSLTGIPGSASNTGGANQTLDTSFSSGLNAGAKAGIGIGIGIAVLAIIALGAFFFIRHRKNKTATANAAAQPPPQEIGQYDGYGGAPGQQYYTGAQCLQGYYPAPQASPPIAPLQGYYDSADAVKQSQDPQGYTGGEGPGGAVLLPNTVHKTIPTAELPAQ
ncbi:hypothetical protein L211DRAFT_724315 [Terfezia boudieri ATCC MYA-4762]|uniref:Mid2 domain-containing protein n=1 Tax=Terfezia boudieri ATCC MYA-4762 TaxID=1051890 RepID=A0A3N4L6L2_9PEZI|nr:hypothetical protein L211DRAFT_724315 [Terfezia boudieri ATCC MYA-4762]